MNVGTSITGSQAQTNNLIIEKYCYGDLPANCITYGGLYQWNEAMQYVASGVNVKGICPTGWHIPSDDELSTLYTTVGGDANSLKAIGQGVGSGAGTNTSGFSVMLSGACYGDGSFGGLGDYTLLWSSIDSGAAGANGMGITFDLSSIGNYSLINKDYGFSVRCVKDWSLLLQSPNGGGELESR